jgi:hypothetical protein
MKTVPLIKTVFGLALAMPLTALGQERVTLELSNFDRGTVQDVFRGAQLRVDLVLVIENEKRSSEVVLDTMQEVVISRSSQVSDERRSLEISAGKIEDILKQHGPAKSAYLKLRFVEVDKISDDLIKEFALSYTILNKMKVDVLALVADATLNVKAMSKRIDWEEIRYYTYEVTVDDYRTEMRWTYFPSPNAGKGGSFGHWGMMPVSVRVGSHQETRVGQTGGGTKASFAIAVAQK